MPTSNSVLPISTDKHHRRGAILGKYTLKGMSTMALSTEVKGALQRHLREVYRNKSCLTTMDRQIGKTSRSVFLKLACQIQYSDEDFGKLMT